MKRLLSILSVCWVFASANAQQVDFFISDGVDNEEIQALMELQVKNLLNAFNTAATTGDELKLNGINIAPLAAQNLTMTWDVVHFAPEAMGMTGVGVPQKNSNGLVYSYQVRDIGVDMKPLNADYDGPTRRILAIDMMPSGKILDVNFAMDPDDYAALAGKDEEGADWQRRQHIIHWCEQFLNAYNKCDMGFMENVFSEDALVITAKNKTRHVPSDVALADPDAAAKATADKARYIAGLRKLFRNNKYLNVRITDYDIEPVPGKPDLYGVTLKQDWTTAKYSAKSNVYMIWDFSNEDKPKIQARIWQPVNEPPLTPAAFTLP